MAPWTSQMISVIDFEGGMASGVLEYGIVGVKDGRIAATATRMCRPVGPIPASDTAIHGLGSLSAPDARPFSAEWDTFADLRERGPLAAHFAGVENALLKSVWPLSRGNAPTRPDSGEAGQAIPGSPDAGTAGRRPGDGWGPWIDTARLAEHFYPRLPSLSLESVVAGLGLSAPLAALAAESCPPGRKTYHCALHDALASALILCALARHPPAAGLTMRQLLTLSTLDSRKREDLVQEEMF